jgi:hypothetical protein
MAHGGRCGIWLVIRGLGAQTQTCRRTSEVLLAELEHAATADDETIIAAFHDPDAVRKI